MNMICCSVSIFAAYLRCDFVLFDICYSNPDAFYITFTHFFSCFIIRHFELPGMK